MRIPLVASSAALLLAACATSKPSVPPPVEVLSTGVPGEAAATRTQKMTATVQSLDVAARKLTLRGPDGKTETMTVPPEVKRLDEIAVGDVIAVEVQQDLVLRYQAPGTEFVPPQAAITGGRAPAGVAPGGAAAAAIQSTVTVTAIDTKSRIVTFQDPDGAQYQVKAGPKLQLEKLKVGDRLLATYVAAVAITVEKAGK
jgi:hypothetical protein